MDSSPSSDKGFTVYSKSGCLNCVHVVKFLESKFIKHKYILCDEELLEDREAFLAKMRDYAGKEVKQFPMVFHDGQFIGGFKETMEFVANFMKELDFYSLDF
jgi:glutaredoxin